MARGRRVPWETLRDEEIGQEEEDNRYFAEQARNQNVDPPQLNTVEEILYVHNADHPGMILVPTQLNGNNFLNWSKYVKRALGARSNLEFLDGSFPKPANSVHYKPWIKVDYLISSWLINSISKEYADAFNHIDTTKKLWDAINQRFNRSNGPKIARLQRDINSYSQGNQSVLVYFNKLTVMWNELDMVLPPLRCVCDARNVAAEQEKNQRLMQFLNGLNESYEHARNQILFLDPMPSIDKAYSMILQVENQKCITDGVGDISGAMAMNIGQNPGDRKGNYQGKQYLFKGRRSKEERMQLYCPRCQRNGHEERECFKLHGYPEWYTKFKEAKGKPRANFVDVKVQNEKSIVNNAEISSVNPEFGKMMQTEFAKYMSNFMSNNASSSSSQVVVNMIQNGSNLGNYFIGNYAFSILKGKQRTHWILDSGASTHICCNPDLLASVVKLPTQQDIYLPDGSIQQVCYSGTASISAAFTLQNVLLAPSFTHNLIYVAQLARDNSAKVLFLSTHCLIQKDDSDNILGIGKACGNLYVVGAENYCNAASTFPSTTQDLHNCLGHHSLSTMAHMEIFKAKLDSAATATIQSCERQQPCPKNKIEPTYSVYSLPSPLPPLPTVARCLSCDFHRCCLSRQQHTSSRSSPVALPPSACLGVASHNPSRLLQFSSHSRLYFELLRIITLGF